MKLEEYQQIKSELEKLKDEMARREGARKQTLKLLKSQHDCKDISEAKKRIETLKAKEEKLLKRIAAQEKSIEKLVSKNGSKKSK